VSSMSEVSPKRPISFLFVCLVNKSKTRIRVVDNVQEDEEQREHDDSNCV
jgi:hypothetical protein